MSNGTPADGNFLEIAMEWAGLTQETLADITERVTKTVSRALAGKPLDTQTFEDFGKALNVDPETLKKRSIPVLDPTTEIGGAFFVIVQSLIDERIPQEADDDLFTYLRGGKFNPINCYSLSLFEWEKLFDHLIRRGHLHRRYDHTVGFAKPTFKDLTETLNAREAFEIHLARSFIDRSRVDQEQIIDSFKKSLALAETKISDSERFIELEAQVHLSWCYDNHCTRQTFERLLKESKRLGDQMLLLNKNEAKRLGKQEPSDDLITSFPSMVTELRTMIRTLSVGMDDIEPTIKAIGVHVKRVHNIAKNNSVLSGRQRKADSKIMKETIAHETAPNITDQNGMKSIR